MSAYLAAARSTVTGDTPPIETRSPEPVLQVDTPVSDAVVAGMVPINGWAFTGEQDFPEGTVELAIDSGRDWVELTKRTHVGGVDPSEKWAARCGFEAALNSYFLPNGKHRLRFRSKNSYGQITAKREIDFKVDNVGRLAETTARLLKAHPGAKRVWTDVIDSADFPFETSGNIAWFDRPDAESYIPEIMVRHNLDPLYAEHLRHFVLEGYIVLTEFVAKEWCEQISYDLDSLITSGVFQYNHPGQRVEKLFEHSKSTRQLWAHPEILKILSALYDDVALPCQTLNFIHGSQQDVHQDLVHLTPFPAGMMCGVWIALEDVHPDSGPLVVYPRSHRLTRLYTRTVPVNKVRDGNWRPFVDKYSPRLKELIKQANLQPMYYTPKAGSVLIWHETLAHGGSPRKSDAITRKSMVSHYFARGGLAFYDSAGTPGWTHED